MVFRMEDQVEFLMEGVIMLTLATIGLVLNITSIFYFARYHHQRTFHRWEDGGSDTTTRGHSTGGRMEDQIPPPEDIP